MTWRLAIDPGLHSPGVVLGDGDQIMHYLIVTPRLAVTAPIGMRCFDIAMQIATWAQTVIHPPYKSRNSEILDIVFEWPQQYDARVIGKTKGNPNNLTPLAGIGMAAAGILWRERADLVTPTPAQWTGQIPKECPRCKQVPGKASCKTCGGSAWKTPRGNLIRENLTAAEIALLPDQNDTIDAAGLFLWCCGRLRSKLPGLVTC